ncbi:hypothetical protein ACHAXR_007698 [Thalassiosira sp. AJA248-18]
MSTSNNDTSNDPTKKTHQTKNKLKTPKDAANAAAGSRQQSNAIRKGANGVILKKFERVMCDMISSSTSSNDICKKALHHLTPRYSKLPQSLTGTEQQELVERAKDYWKSRGLMTSSSSRDTADYTESSSSPWPFDSQTSLPQCGGVRGGCDSQKIKIQKTKTGKDTGGVGDVQNNERAWRKETQLANIIQCVLALLPDDVRQQACTTADGFNAKRTSSFRIVDFAGGTGHIAVPLALLLPHCEVVCVDLKKWSLDLLHQRVDGPFNIDVQKDKPDSNSHKLPCQSNTVHTSKALPNLSSYHGSIQTYPDKFDIGVSLHACGEASDWVLRKCLQQNASWAVCSCCCGKLRREAHNPYVFQSTGENEKEIHYPQSTVFSSLGGRRTTCADDNCNDSMTSLDAKDKIIISDNQQRMTSEMFDELARAADYSELGDVRKPRNACRRAAKSLVEWDRFLFAKESMQCTNSFGNTDNQSKGNVVLTRMIPWEASPKNDVLIGWFQSNPYRPHTMPSASLEPVVAPTPEEDLTCDVDFQVALHHLFGENISHSNHVSTNGKGEFDRLNDDQNDWTAEEEADIKFQMEEFLQAVNEGVGSISNKSKTLKFPTGMGPRKRKLVHYVAESLGLRHWGEGKKDSEKIVAVALRQK